ncbi:hypothetical protein IQ03_04770 [Gemmobacter caeni]|uniref:Uncharacterized protein n=1 Tax=Gemmobacter caeni TaxID=589035 RepID=A0A2T6AJ86_9RHOB|nr:hypothetical protein [Gemmobacter caeni]PTX43895.1 hypothetical protein C8N34_12428 [Gemmobacter caeni]TWI93490.1 hypothetical protein IQ03_04770 [Gemmobacter caeni]
MSLYGLMHDGKINRLALDRVWIAPFGTKDAAILGSCEQFMNRVDQVPVIDAHSAKAWF